MTGAVAMCSCCDGLIVARLYLAGTGPLFLCETCDAEEIAALRADGLWPERTRPSATQAGEERG